MTLLLTQPSIEDLFLEMRESYEFSRLRRELDRYGKML